MSDQSVEASLPSPGKINRGRASNGVRASILHISDLHFGRSLPWGRPVNEKILPQLCRLAKHEKVSPDFIVVSGDLVESPSLRAMKEAYEFILTLAETAEVPPQNVLIIPGNHDYKVAGNFGLTRASRIPFQLYFRGDWKSRQDWNSHREWISKSRFGDFIRLLPNSFRSKGKSLGDEPVRIIDESRKVIIFGIQSTPIFESLATGHVSSEQISALTNELERNKEPWAELFKVVVVHHHPFPMAYDKTNARARLEESGMVFYNAGGFLRELSRHGIDLILHGHKHVAGFRRAVYDFEDKTRRSIGVMAAGSATHKNPGDDLGNEFNVIRIYDDDRVEIDRWYYSPDVRRKDESHVYDLYDLNDVREHRTQRHYRHDKVKVGRFSEIVSLTRDGYSQIEFQLRECQVCDHDAKLLAYEFDEFKVERPCYLRDPRVVGEGTTFRFPTMEIKSDSHPWNLAGKISFGAAPVTSASPPFDLKYTFRLMNGHALTAKEFQRRYKGRKYEGEEVKGEFASIECERACEILKLVVRFPDDFDMTTISAQEAFALYRPNTANGKAGLQPHGEETDRIKNRLSVEGKSLVLEINSPIPEFSYRVLWSYKLLPVSEESATLTERELEDARKQLIEIARKADGDEKEAYQSIHESLLKFLTSVASRYPERKQDERLDISLIVFDDENSVLRFVASGLGLIGPLFDETLMTGEGCAGFCFEKAKVVYYDRERDPIGYYIDPDEVSKAWGRHSSLKKAEALIAIPWMVPGVDVPMGVLSIYSLNSNSRLLHSVYVEKNKREEETNALISLTQTLGTIILAHLRGRTLSEGESSDTQSDDSLGRNG